VIAAGEGSVSRRKEGCHLRGDFPGAFVETAVQRVRNLAGMAAFGDH